MWWTELGDRVLIGAEAELFREGLIGLVFRLEDGLDYHVGVRVFDTLSVPERLAALEHVTRALFLKSVPSPRLTAVSEGAVAAIYQQLLNDVEVEMDEDRYHVRRLVRKACKQCQISSVPKMRSQKFQEWQDCFEYLLDRIFWDRDWEEEFIKPDDHPDKAHSLKRLAGISDDYYTAVPSDPNSEQLARIKASLRRLCNKQFKST